MQIWYPEVNPNCLRRPISTLDLPPPLDSTMLVPQFLDAPKYHIPNEIRWSMSIKYRVPVKTKVNDMFIFMMPYDAENTSKACQITRRSPFQIPSFIAPRSMLFFMCFNGLV